MSQSGQNIFLQGVRDGIPIAACYFAVSFSMGIVARNAGLVPATGFLCSLFTRASAGEFGAYTLFAANASYMAVIVMCVVVNLRYLLMSATITQKLPPDIGLFQKILVGCCMTDEVYGISIAYKGCLQPKYTYGAMSVAGVMWAAGTASGIAAGNSLPADIVSALGVALYGMFISIVVTAARKHWKLTVAVTVACLLSWICSVCPVVRNIDNGTRTMILTVIVSLLFAWLLPASVEVDDSKVTGEHD
ncbi:MAG: AzlC family ABC transporter permease [Bacteroidaceae bacterium]|nr:AzlC family ABC transporter permease [Bacteroidaceae bacterium]